DRVLLVVSWQWARWVERLFGTQRLQPQLCWLVLAALVAGLWPVLRRGLEFGPLPWSPVDPALALGAAWQAKFHRFAALALAGGAGLVVCLTFVRGAAPDLALTQLMVEIVTTVLLLLGLRWLPKRIPFAWTSEGAHAARPRRLGDLALAVRCGVGVAALAYAVMTRPLPETISSYFMENAWPLGGGSNVVNVIIVDFRGFDTLGEISVLCVVAITVYSLLRRFRPAPESTEPLPQRIGQSRTTMREDLAIPGVIMRWMF